MPVTVSATKDSNGALQPVAAIPAADGSKLIVADGVEFLEFSTAEAPLLDPASLRNSNNVTIPATYFGNHVSFGAPNTPSNGSVQVPLPSIGIGTLRSWDDYTTHRQIEAVKGTRDWTRPDYVINRNSAAGLRTIVCPLNPPDWATATPGQATYNAYPYASLGDITSFIGEHAARYAGTVWMYEGRNEANSYLQPQQIGYNGTIAQLVDEQATLYAAVKANCSALVSIPPMSQTASPQAQQFLDDFLAAAVADGRPFCDAISVHGYLPLQGPPEALIGGTIALRLILQKYGLHTLPLINSEYGYIQYKNVNTGALVTVSGNPMPQAQQNAYLARMRLCGWLAGYSVSCYYGFDKNTVMNIGMINYPTDVNTLLQPALIDRYLSGLLVGGTLSGFSDLGLYSAQFQTGDSRSGKVVWCKDGATSSVSASGYTSATDCLGNAVSLTGGSVTATYSPTFLFR